ncbi:DUF2515 family protein [Paenibacillus glacialis]|uniref:DUF2515 domain-containing protein n=1 Tax=Paenibacillus glacialis TaxID=494026 RepID=A0A168NMG1_9BACL|nr:DUF2515 family protein [Paenibacillus glacialis]OAB45939.1 hypothetical protein PGLA_00650 [Paenibacillus glacialis]
MSYKHSDSHLFGDMLSLVKTLPQQTTQALKGKYACWKLSRPFHKHRRNLNWNEAAAQIIRDQVERTVDEMSRSRNINIYKEEVNQPPFTEADDAILRQIQIDTTTANKSNITRTQAYLQCYESNPELHWALLAHMVSRNGGWNMSDLKGGLVADLTNTSLRDDIYRMLERCNALIFQDAYPQLQLYLHSKKQGRSYFHLLPKFHVSSFMNSFWNNFWIDRNSALLTVGLIINEQTYIEGRVVQHSYFQKNVFQKPEYKLHHLAHVNQILFPLDKICSNAIDDKKTTPSPGLVGLVLENFGNIEERINLGKSLYGLLFGYREVLDHVTSYAKNTTFQGSRSEYWPHLFTPDRETALNSPLESSELLEHEWLPPGQKIYSPVLNHVWFDMPYDPIPHYDWLKNKNVTQYISKPSRPILIEMSHDHRSAIQKTALAHDIVRGFT